jgi:uncharacterized membrane protein YgcG
MKLGDPDKVLTGMHQYRIGYTVNGAVRLSKNNPELYWNIIGTGWKMPIEQAEGYLFLPAGLSTSTAKAVCFVGNTGSKQKATTTINGKDIEFTTDNLSPGQGLTMAVQLPADSIKIPGLIDEWLWNLEQTGLLVAAGLSFVLGWWAFAVLLLGLLIYRANTVQNANWDSSGSSSTDFGSAGGGFGGGGGGTW